MEASTESPRSSFAARLWRTGRQGGVPAVLLVCALLAVNVALAVAVLKPSPRPVADRQVPLRATGTQNRLTVATGPPVVAPVPPALDLADGVVMRAGASQCGAGPASLYRSGDGGRTWQALATPASTILRVHVIDRWWAWFVGTDRSCQPRFYLTSDAGRTWHVREETTGTWYRLPDPAARSVHAPGGLVNSPCADRRILEVVGVTPDNGAVLCDDGSVYRSGDGGASWKRTALLPGARALSFPSVQTGFVAVVDAACPGLRVNGSGDGGQNWRPLGCVRADTRQPSALAFAGPMEGLLATQSGAFATSDGGLAWRDWPTPGG